MPIHQVRLGYEAGERPIFGIAIAPELDEKQLDKFYSAQNVEDYVHSFHARAEIKVEEIGRVGVVEINVVQLNLGFKDDTPLKHEPEQEKINRYVETRGKRDREAAKHILDIMELNEKEFVTNRGFYTGGLFYATFFDPCLAKKIDTALQPTVK